MKSALTLRAENLCVRAGGAGRVLCEGLDLQVQAGQRWALLGPNGAGKSTLLATLAGLMPPAHGEVRLDNRNLRDWPPRTLAAARAWCPPFWNDPFGSTVMETIALARDDAAPVDERAELLERFDIAHLSDHDVRTLSGGERQRVALATAWWQNAPFLLLDEPTSHLDLAHQHSLVRSLKDWCTAGGAAVVSLHDLNIAWQTATHAVLLDGRGKAWVGPREEVITPAHLAAAFGVAVSWVEVCGERRLWVEALA
jgi:iron complex transport system ATP-binding protein